MGRRSLISLLAVVTIFIVAAAATIVTVARGGDSGLVRSLSGGQADEPEAAKPPVADAGPTHPLRDADDAADAPSETDDGSGSGPADEPAQGDTNADEAAMAPFVGDWIEVSSREGARFEVSLRLTDDGRFLATATAWGPGGGAPDTDAGSAGTAPVAPTPLFRASVAGVWSVAGSSVVLTREASDRPDLLPEGQAEVFWESRVADGVWTYRDTAGLERSMIRP